MNKNENTAPLRSFKERDEFFMARCIELAKKGYGKVSPNPMVGCVIVRNGKIISEGYHEKYGGFHGERIAINTALRKNIKIRGATLYVNLEPCIHYGKTPPCTNIIAEHKIKRVVYGITDPNPLVAGKGISYLKKHNIEVTGGILDDECRELNKFFLKYIKKRIPYVTLKAAQTLDGKIADTKYHSKWISSLESRKLVHLWRSRYDALLIGNNTLIHDNPSLTVRYASGRNPFRIVIANKIDINEKYEIFCDKNTGKTIIVTLLSPDKKTQAFLNKKRIRVIIARKKDSTIDLKDALKKLGKFGISSILVEGGAYTFSEFLNQKTVDEMCVFTAPMIMGDGIETFKNISYRKFVNAKSISCDKIGSDILTKIIF
jgi:diaminohydroxyphosphoribosylaminopyrimidine deaminase/5-amino-6-(5-phosphoribosylamino)uracil reductase